MRSAAWQRPDLAGAPAGANAIPVDIFHSKSTAAAMRQLVDTAVDANMNMIRIWGGGMYYRDDFYDYCDRAGMLVWQEAMFACSLYPADTDFLDNVIAAALAVFWFSSPLSSPNFSRWLSMLMDSPFLRLTGMPQCTCMLHALLPAQDTSMRI